MKYSRLSLSFVPMAAAVLHKRVCVSAPLATFFARPFAKHWTEHAGSDYYVYHQVSDRSYPGIHAFRNFRANLVRLVVRYAF